jgi:hypothetical protein
MKLAQQVLNKIHVCFCEEIDSMVEGRNLLGNKWSFTPGEWTKFVKDLKGSKVKIFKVKDSGDYVGSIDGGKTALFKYFADDMELFADEGPLPIVLKYGK